ncbi:MAG: hypothetical protein CMN28_01035 [Salinisphaeraceae bacterium]|jgi:hypothetical protein|nr:hypothetical protein [Salinisphaeraceae bacterium]
MRIYETKWFARWAKGQPLSDAALAAAIEEMERGLVDADLGGLLFKKRVGHSGKGKSGGTRALVAWRSRNRAVLIYGFAKNQRDNISARELKALKLLAREFMGYEEKQLKRLVRADELLEVEDDE